MGELRLIPRPGERTLTRADRRLLDDLARQVGVAAHAVRLTRDVPLAERVPLEPIAILIADDLRCSASGCARLGAEPDLTNVSACSWRDITLLLRERRISDLAGGSFFQAK